MKAQLNMATSISISTCKSSVQLALAEAKKRGQPEEGRLKYRELTEQMLTEVTRLSLAERLVLMNNITRDESGFLFGVALSIAIWSVRESTSARLSFGVLALIVENCQEDWRETLIHLCLLNHSANKMGVNLKDEYAEVRQFAAPDTLRLMDGYFHAGEKDISAMGYVEVDDEGGFNYKRTW